MAPLSPDNTPRFEVFYTNVSMQHSMQFRSHLSPSALGTLVGGFFTTLIPVLPATVIDTVTWAPAGSSIFNPVTTGIEGNTYGSGAGTPDSNAATFWSWIGRTSGGRRVRLYVFGTGGMGNDYRYGAGEQTQLTAARNYLAGLGTDLRGIDDLAPVWKTYINAGVNRHIAESMRP